MSSNIEKYQGSEELLEKFKSYYSGLKTTTKTTTISIIVGTSLIIL